MKRYIITYLMVLFALLFVNCTTTTEGLDEAEILVVSVEDIEMDYKGGRETIDIDSFCSWVVSSSEDWSWITTNYKKGEKGSRSIQLVVSPNDTTEPRSATITIENKLHGVSRDISVLQKAGMPFINVSATEIESLFDGETQTITIESNIDYTITSSESWCNVSTDIGEQGNHSVDITIDKNVVTTKRTAVVTVANKAKKVSKEIAISQEAFSPTMNVDTETIESTVDGLDKSVTIEGNISWAASCEADWVTITPANGEMGTSTLKITVAPNATTSSRNAVVKVTNSEYSVEKQIAISQVAFEPKLDTFESSISAKVEGYTKVIVIEGNISWTASCEANWVTVTPANGDKGTSTLKVTVAPNATTSSRNTVVKVANSEYSVEKQITISQVAFEPTLSVNTETIDALVSGYTKIITIESNISWTTSCEADWVTITPANGDKGTSTLKVTIAPNATTSPRNAVVKVANSEYSVEKQITISQAAFGPTLNVDTESITASIEGLDKSVTIEGNISWAASCEADWVTITPANGDKGTSTLKVTIAPNATTSSRNTVVKVANSEYSIEKQIAISQVAFGPTLNVDTESITASIEGLDKSVTIEGNISWAASCEADWVTITPANGDKGTSTLKVTVAPNATTSSRNTVVKVANSEYSVEKQITISQVAFGPTLNVDTESITASIEGLDKSVAIEGNISWTASCEADWVTITPANGDKGTSTLKVTIAPNATTSSRNTVVKVANSEYSIEKQIAISQVAFEPALNVSTETFDIPVEGLEKSVAIEGNISWTASCEADWVTISPANGDKGTSTLKVTIAPNATTSSRSAVVKVANSEYSVEKQIAISQAAFVPELEVSDVSVSAKNEGETKEVTVTSNIPWSVSCETDWVAFSPVNGQKGSTTLKMTILPNASSDARSTVVKIINSEYNTIKEITVNQMAFVPTLTVQDVTSLNLDFASGEQSIAIDANIDYNVAVNVDWISANKITTGIKFRYTTNDGIDSRSGQITLSNDQYSLSAVINLTQAPFPAGNIIRYTTTNNGVIMPNASSFGSANIISITNEGGEGIIMLDAPVSMIGANAFKDCTNLVSLNIPSGVIAIEESAFYGCSNLASVTIPDSVATIGDNAFYNCSSLANVTIPANVTALGDYVFYNCSSLANATIPSGITTIGDFAFYNCSSLSSFTIPEGVTSIGVSAFGNCVGELVINSPIIETSYSVSSYPASSTGWLYDAKFTQLTIGNSISKIGSYAFRDCSSLTSISIGNGVTTIGNNAFYECSGLTSVTIPNSVETIGGSAFYGCTNLANATLPSNITSIEDYVFYNCSNLASVNIPSKVTSIGNNAFYNCSSLANITIPKSVAAIGGSAFYNCTGELVINSLIIENNYSSSNYPAYSSSNWLYGNKFSKLTVGSDVSEIGSYVFRNCSSLTEVNLPSSVTSIGSYVFYGCSKITSITIPKDITSIENYTFYGCSNLQNVTIPSKVTSIGNYAFYNCTNLDSITIPKSVTFIGSSAFAYCTGELIINSSLVENSYTASNYPTYSSSFWLYNNRFSKLTIGEDISEIGSYVFRNCSYLTEVNIPSSVISIGSYAFYNCYGLTSITLPVNITSIESYAFYNCSNLNRVNSPSRTAPTCGTYAFTNNASTRKIYVPIGCLAEYQSKWSSYSSSIVEIGYTPTECTSLTITADDVLWNATSTTIYYTAVTNGTTEFGPVSDVTITGTAQSSSFEQNMSETTDITRTISYTYLGQTASTTITQSALTGWYTVNLNNQWRMSTSVSNPDSSTYDGVYESYSNYNQNNGIATMSIDINSYETFTIYVRSNGENNFDYITVYDLDSTSSVKMTTKGMASSNTSISSYSAVTFSNIDRGSHRITIKYSKDSSVNSGTDSGYVLIPKNQ